MIDRGCGVKSSASSQYVTIEDTLSLALQVDEKDRPRPGLALVLSDKTRTKVFCQLEAR
jgi:hypothetical protein